MTSRSQRRFRDDDRGSLPVGADTTFTAMVAAVLGVPLVAALAGAVVQRANAFQYVFTGAAALVAAFTLTGTTGFSPGWTVVGILAILAAIAAHVWQFRHDRLDLVIVGSIYTMPVALAAVLLLQAAGSMA